MTTYTSPFTGQTITPSQVGYESLTISASTTLSWPSNGTNSTTVATNIVDVTATTTGLLLLMPTAAQVSVGQAIIVRNIGSNPFTITDNLGNTIVSATSGIAYYIWLTNNTVTAFVDGTWATVTFGAGTSAANASSLAGYGLTAIGNTLNQQYYVSTYSSNTTLSSTARAQMNVWTGGAGTFTLPSASTVGANWFTIFKNDGAGILTLQPNGTDTIDGNSIQQLQLNESIVLVSSGTTAGWYSYAYGRSNQFSYTELALVVTGGTTTLSSTQASNTIQIYTGTLTSNQTIVVPSTVQLYTFTNNTTGSYTFTVKTSVTGGATVTIPQSNSLILVCDGTNVYNAASGSSNSYTTITIGTGSPSVPSINFTGDANTGIYHPTTGQVGFSSSGTQVGYFYSAGLYVIGSITSTVGLSGGTF